MWIFIFNFVKKFFKKKQKEIEYKFGWLKDELDERDHWFFAPIPPKEEQPIDLRPLCPPVLNQGNLGACTAFGTNYVVQFARKKQNLKQSLDPSALFTYYNTRLLQNTTNQDSGGSIRNAIKAVVKYGVVKEQQWPYTVEKFAEKPSDVLYTEASKFQALGYQRIRDTSTMDMCKCLEDGYPFVFGMLLFESFFSDKVMKTGVYDKVAKTLDREKENIIGSHCMTCVGWKFINNKRFFIVQNSWSDKWGDKGYCYIPFDCFRIKGVVSDIWTIRTMEN